MPVLSGLLEMRAERCDVAPVFPSRAPRPRPGCTNAPFPEFRAEPDRERDVTARVNRGPRSLLNRVRTGAAPNDNARYRNAYRPIDAAQEPSSGDAQYSCAT